MGYRLKYHGLRIRKLNETLSGKKLKNKYVIIDSRSMIVSGVRGISKAEAKKQIKYYRKVREFKFTG